jgi:flavastacin
MEKKKVIIMCLCLALAALALFDCEPPAGDINAANPSPSAGDSAVNPLVDKGDYYLLGGDIMLYKQDPGHLAIINAIQANNGGSRAAKDWYVSTWTTGVPFYFNADFSDVEKTTIKIAIATVESMTGIQFRYSDNFLESRLEFKRLSDPMIAGRSTLGKGLINTMELNTVTHIVVLHELMHTLGLVHEHMRKDRDSYITVLTANILPSAQDQFSLLQWSTNYGAYDYS